VKPLKRKSAAKKRGDLSRTRAQGLPARGVKRSGTRLAKKRKVATRVRGFEPIPATDKRTEEKRGRQWSRQFVLGKKRLGRECLNKKKMVKAAWVRGNPKRDL